LASVEIGNVRMASIETEMVVSQSSVADQGVVRIPVIIGGTLAQVSASWSCPLCDGPAQAVNLGYAVPYRSADGPRVAVCEEVPGYRCPACEFESYDLLASIEAIRAVLEVVRAAGDQETAARLAASLSAGQAQLAVTTASR
jgi:hypothetical protein